MDEIPHSREAVSKRLVRLRRALELTQMQLCRRTGIAHNAWNHYERGRNRISVDHAALVAQHLGVTLDWIYLGAIRTLSAEIAYALGRDEGAPLPPPREYRRKRTEAQPGS